MTKTSQFLQLVPARVKAALERIESRIWSDPQPVSIAQTAVTSESVPWSRARRARRESRTPPFHWGRLFHSTWFRLTWPDEPRGPTRWLRWLDQAEATLYVEGRPYYGFDVAHRFAPLPRGVSEVWIESVCCQSAIWHPGATGLDPRGSRCEGAQRLVRDDAAWRAYHDLLVLYELALHHLAKVDPIAASAVERPGRRAPLTTAPVLLRRLLCQLDDAINAYDRNGLSALRIALRRIYRSWPAGGTELTAIMVGHAHIDLVWLWPERVGETKAVHTFATMDRLMEMYPEFRFTYSQPASYVAVAKRSPVLMRRVDRWRRQGRWEATGAAWVESDTLLACGEALLRGFQLGQAAFVRMNGRPSTVLWLPDAFGYAACIPQLLRLVGVTGFFTNKITWSRISGFPHSSFQWRSPDGSAVLAHVSHEARQFYNGQATVRELSDGAESYRQSDVHDAFLAPTGYGDGGGGPTEEMCERVRRLADLASLPRAQWGGVEAYFERLQRSAGRLPVWDGEIYLEYHRGTYTTHGTLKHKYRRAERALQCREAVHCAVGAGAVEDQIWQRLVMAQFHDALPGSSIHEVCDALVRELGDLATAQLKDCKGLLEVSGGARERIFNPLPVPMALPVKGREGLLQAIVPPLSGVALHEAEVRPVVPVKVTASMLDNGIVQVVLTDEGELRSLTVRGAPVAWTGAGAQLWMYADKPHAFDAWDLDRHVLNLGSRVGGKVRLTPSGAGTERGEIAFERRLGSQGRIRTVYALAAGESVLRIRYELDWQHPQTLVKAVFPTAYRGRMARFGAPYGSVLRSQAQGRPEDEAQWEVPGSRWALVSDDGEREGLMLMTESRYGFSCRDGVLATSLLRSALVTGEGAKFQRPMPPALRDHRGPAYSDLGQQTIELAVGRFDGAAGRAAMPAELAETVFAHPVRYRGAACSAGLLGLEGGNTLIPAWAKPVGRRMWLLRCHETMGQRGRVTLRLAPGWIACRADPDEKPAGRPVRTFSFRPYEIVSLILSRRSA